jgi:hypothetical protein
MKGHHHAAAHSAHHHSSSLFDAGHHHPATIHAFNNNSTVFAGMNHAALHNSGGYGRFPFPAVVDEDAIFTLRSKNLDSQCGCPIGCKGQAMACNFVPHFIPDELNEIMTLQEFTEFVAEIDKALQDTHLPMMPCLFGHFCIPFSPICAMMYCQAQRSKRIDAILANSTSKLAERGYYWEQYPVFTIGIAVLKINRTAAAKYADEHGLSVSKIMQDSSMVVVDGSAPVALAMPMTNVEMVMQRGGSARVDT